MNKSVEEIIFTGRVLHELKLVSSHGGNLSIREDDFLYITKTGRMAGFLKEEDIIKLPIYEKTEQDKEASIELIVHREIYKRNPDIKAVVHAHPITAITLAYFLQTFKPMDIEGELFIKEVPILEVEKPSASEELAIEVSETFKKKFKICIVKNHGTFSAGKSINEALKYTSTLENSAEIYYKWLTLKKINF